MLLRPRPLNAAIGQTVYLEHLFMKTARAILASLALFAVGAPGMGGGVALAHEEEDYRPGGSAYQAG